MILGVLTLLFVAAYISCPRSWSVCDNCSSSSFKSDIIIRLNFQVFRFQILRLRWPRNRILKFQMFFLIGFAAFLRWVMSLLPSVFFNWWRSVLVFTYKITSCLVVKDVQYMYSLPSVFWSMTFFKFLWRYFLVESLIMISLEENIHLNTSGTSIIYS